ncbi:uncharacterized protein TRUGW13939_10331 [Talaromyces rugulosus]|uniref:Uncharacterized protein n=1 Tax=Talaromyces rugulosus TaxID=121627 RepID=A0A7H8R9X5_TALRU|nr:uncharacterized protein TRUGW13939_10331 [Talaromyces rugulosus]QKX63162.1 hypothetical protein TRUGW13939_10331 [Talaromyces rugulosus]
MGTQRLSPLLLPAQAEDFPSEERRDFKRELNGWGNPMPTNTAGNDGAQQQIILVAICVMSQMGSTIFVSEGGRCVSNGQHHQRDFSILKLIVSPDTDPELFSHADLKVRDHLDRKSKHDEVDHGVDRLTGSQEYQC